MEFDPDKFLLEFIFKNNGSLLEISIFVDDWKASIYLDILSFIIGRIGT